MSSGRYKERKITGTWSCKWSGLASFRITGQKTRSSLKFFNTTDVAPLRRKQGLDVLQAQCGMEWRAEGCPDASSYKREGCVCGAGGAPTPGNWTPLEGPRESKHLQEGRRDKQAPGQGRKEGKDLPGTKPFYLTI